jgi:hypothetical protein
MAVRVLLRPSCMTQLRHKERVQATAVESRKNHIVAHLSSPLLSSPLLPAKTEGSVDSGGEERNEVHGLLQKYQLATPLDSPGHPFGISSAFVSGSCFRSACSETRQ